MDGSLGGVITSNLGLHHQLEAKSSGNYLKDILKETKDLWMPQLPCHVELRLVVAALNWCTKVSARNSKIVALKFQPEILDLYMEDARHRL